MALRKPLFMQTEGYSEEMAATDSMALGALTMGGNIDMQLVNKVVNLATPTADGDAANKAYVDGVAQSLSIKAPVLVLQTVESDGRADAKAVAVANVASLSGLSEVIDGVALSNDGDRVFLQGQTTGSENGLWIVHATAWTRPTDFPAGFHAYKAWVHIAAGGTSYANSSWVCTTAGPTDVVDTHSLTFVRALYGLSQTIDGVAISADGTRVLVVDAADPLIYSGIWLAHAGAWTRATDMPGGSHAGHLFCFIEQGTDYGNTGWVCTSDPPNDVVGTDGLEWVQFSAAGQITAGPGLQKVGNVISVKKGDGIEVTSNGAATNIDLATNPGLTLSGTSPNKKLAALIASSQGLQIDGANGLALLLNGTTLQVGVSGVSVKGVPNLFEVGGTATSQTPGTGQVTAANLNTLTAGGTSNADSLHTHALPSVPYAGRVESSLAVAEAVAAGDPVYQSSTNDRVGKADASNDAKSRVFGVARVAQNTVGDPTPVVYVGPCPGILSGATAGDAYYLQAGGGLGTSLPGAGRRVIRVGVAKNATDLHVFVLDYGKKAA